MELFLPHALALELGLPGLVVLVVVLPLVATCGSSAGDKPSFNMTQLLLVLEREHIFLGFIPVYRVTCSV